MRKITAEELEPLAEIMRKRRMTLEQIQETCQVNRRTAYRYLTVLRQVHTVGEAKLASGTQKFFWIASAA